MTTTTLAKPAYVPPVFDGYVDAKSIKMHGPNVNFLQVNGTNFALEERGVDSENRQVGAAGGVDGENIASRQIVKVVMLVVIAALIVTGFALLIVGHIKGDIPRREAYTQGVVINLYNNDTTLNYVVCHSPYTFAFDGTQGTDWNHLHQELDISFGRSIGYEIYWFRSGSFTRQGDGGYVNWAYIGNVVSRNQDGTIFFAQH